MKEQIEGMAFDLCRIDTCKHLPQEECNNTTCAHCEAEALYNAGYRKQKEGEWISVEDRLPEKPMTCLVYVEHYGIYVSFYNEGFYTKYVTHWMPLPEPPEMKGGAE